MVSYGARLGLKAGNRGRMIKFDNVHFQYSDSSIVFDRFSLLLETNTASAVLGPSGCGKSTLVKLSCGLLKLQSGQITVGGTTTLDTGSVRGVLFQDDTLLPWLRSTENIVFPQSLRSDPSLRKYALEKLEALGLKDAADKRAWELSSGMKKRIEFLRALAADERFLVADEPFTAIDFHQKRRLWKEWNNIRSARSRTCLLVTHDINEAIELADRIIVLSASSPTQVTLDVSVEKQTEATLFELVRQSLSLRGEAESLQ